MTFASDWFSYPISNGGYVYLINILIIMVHILMYNVCLCNIIIILINNCNDKIRSYPEQAVYMNL